VNVGIRASITDSTAVSCIKMEEVEAVEVVGGGNTRLRLWLPIHTCI
jgi:hypothetical protein